MFFRNVSKHVPDYTSSYDHSYRSEKHEISRTLGLVFTTQNVKLSVPHYGGVRCLGGRDLTFADPVTFTDKNSYLHAQATLSPKKEPPATVRYNTLVSTTVTRNITAVAGKRIVAGHITD
jgi:hypothetical protein